MCYVSRHDLNSGPPTQTPPGVPVKPLELHLGYTFKKVKAVTGNESNIYLTIKKEEGMSVGPEKRRRYGYWLYITYQ